MLAFPCSGITPAAMLFREAASGSWRLQGKDVSQQGVEDVTVVNPLRGHASRSVTRCRQAYPSRGFPSARLHHPLSPSLGVLIPQGGRIWCLSGNLTDSVASLFSVSVSSSFLGLRRLWPRRRRHSSIRLTQHRLGFLVRSVIRMPGDRCFARGGICHPPFPHFLVAVCCHNDKWVRERRSSSLLTKRALGPSGGSQNTAKQQLIKWTQI